MTANEYKEITNPINKVAIYKPISRIVKIVKINLEEYDEFKDTSYKVINFIIELDGNRFLIPLTDRKIEDIFDFNIVLLF